MFVRDICKQIEDELLTEHLAVDDNVEYGNGLLKAMNILQYYTLKYGALEIKD